jgi:uncharacterized protein YukE
MPGFDGYAIDTVAVDGEKAQLNSLFSQIEQTMHELNSKVNNFVANNEGAEVDAYTEAQTKWNQGLEEMREALHGHGQTLGKINEHYVQSSQNMTKLFM